MITLTCAWGTIPLLKFSSAGGAGNSPHLLVVTNLQPFPLKQQPSTACVIRPSSCSSFLLWFRFLSRFSIYCLSTSSSFSLAVRNLLISLCRSFPSDIVQTTTPAAKAPTATALGRSQALAEDPSRRQQHCLLELLWSLLPFALLMVLAPGAHTSAPAPVTFQVCETVTPKTVNERRRC